MPSGRLLGAIWKRPRGKEKQKTGKKSEREEVRMGRASLRRGG